MDAFIIAEIGPHDIAGVFEDDGETGNLYIFDEQNGRGIIDHLHVYSRSNELNVTEDDVTVVWSADGSKCGVVIWNGMRGIIDIKNELKLTSEFLSPDSLPILDPQWLSDFEVGTDQSGGQKDS